MFIVLSTWWLFVYAKYCALNLRYIPFPKVEPADKIRKFIILIPCHNEELVIRNTIKSIMQVDYPSENYLLLVIDDGSADDTSQIVQSLQDEYENLHLVIRTPEEGGKGKSEALNQGYRHLLATGLLDSEEEYIVGVCDADGRIDDNMFWSAETLFQDDQIGACQAGVRILGRENSLLLRFQDMEFVLYSYVTQSIRSLCLGNASLGGNGQFIRQTALESVKFTRDELDYWWNPTSLSEDLEIGLRVKMKGYDVGVVPDSFVHQQGLTSWRKLIFRQRTRWAWGTIQVSLKYLFTFQLFRGQALSLEQKLDWLILLTLWGVSVALPVVWLLSLLHLMEIIIVGTPVTFWAALAIGFLWIPLIMLGVREVREYRRWRTIIWTLGFFFYLLHGIFCYYYALIKVITFQTPDWDKTARVDEETL